MPAKMTCAFGWLTHQMTAAFNNKTSETSGYLEILPNVWRPVTSGRSAYKRDVACKFPMSHVSTCTPSIQMENASTSVDFSVCLRLRLSRRTCIHLWYRNLVCWSRPRTKYLYVPWPRLWQTISVIYNDFRILQEYDIYFTSWNFPFPIAHPHMRNLNKWTDDNFHDPDIFHFKNCLSWFFSWALTCALKSNPELDTPGTLVTVQRQAGYWRTRS